MVMMIIQWLINDWYKYFNLYFVTLVGLNFHVGTGSKRKTDHFNFKKLIKINL